MGGNHRPLLTTYKDGSDFKHKEHKTLFKVDNLFFSIKDRVKISFI